MNEMRIELVLHHSPDDLLDVHEIVKHFMQLKHDHNSLRPELNITDEPAGNDKRIVTKCPICKGVIMQGLIYEEDNSDGEDS
jgi:hypothetical protein